jgi:dipeptidyl aminopeptidase/acylaminoacyl peptidase
VKSGTVDAKRVCIVGSSYGGYAALWGATRNPERYRCAVSFAGVTDLRRQLRYSSDFFVKRRYAREWKRKVQGDKDFDLDSVSPLKHVADLKVPVLVVHGDDDQIVPVKQSSLYGQALQKAGKVHEFHLFKGEGHGLSSEANEKEWLDRLERFLAKHNPAG